MKKAHSLVQERHGIFSEFRHRCPDRRAFFPVQWTRYF